MVDLEKLRVIASKYNLWVIEDASHALGADYLDSKVGSCKYSDMTIFSFHPVKSIAMGEGGVITTNNNLNVIETRETPFCWCSCCSRFGTDLICSPFVMHQQEMSLDGHHI